MIQPKELAVGAVGLLGAFSGAQAQEFQSEGVFELEYVRALNDPGPSEEAPSVTVEWLGQGALGERTRISLGLMLEPVSEHNASRFLSREGLYLNTLAISYETRNHRFEIGKIAPAFGTAWDITPGVYGTELAEEYELTEKLGIAAETQLSDMLGLRETVLAVRGALFRNDTSIFSDSLIRQRGRQSVADGAPGSTDNLQSVLFGLSISEALVPGLTIDLSHRRLAGAGPAPDETAFVAGAVLETNLSSGHALIVNWEYMEVEARENLEPGYSISTIGAVLEQEDWRFSLSCSEWDENHNLSSPHSYCQIGAGWTMTDELDIDLGWKMSDTGDQIGIILSRSWHSQH